MARKTIRVYPDGNVWVVKKDGTNRASAIKNTKQEALEAARDIALNQGLAVAIHGKDGKIQKIVRPEDRGSKDDCFITTACVRYYGLQDDCHQLQTLRKFRDTHLINSTEGKELVKKYYILAPTIVKLLNTDKEKATLFDDIFQNITSACTAIKNKQLDKATSIYTGTVVDLLNRYKIK